MPDTMLRLAAAVGLLVLADPAAAAEGGSGVYLLGVRGPMAGVTPPEGVFFSDQLYMYDAGISRNIVLDSGQIAASMNANVIVNIPTALWITPVDILGGDLGFSVTAPFGRVDVDAAVGPLSLSDDVMTFGDPSVAAFLGWHSGNFHWQAGVTGFLPIGDYQEGEIANLAKHRLSADVYGALTWLDPKIGLDVSNVIGVTFNSENDATDYRTGDEFHWEWALMKNLTPSIAVGPVGYYYHQLTGDSGAGATLGDFKGEVAAVGAAVSGNFEIGKIPVSTQVRYYHEFDTTNRLEGDSVFVSLSLPLWVPH